MQRRRKASHRFLVDKIQQDIRAGLEALMSPFHLQLFSVPQISGDIPSQNQEYTDALGGLVERPLLLKV